MSFFMKSKKKMIKNVAFVAVGLFIVSVILGAGVGALDFGGNQGEADLEDYKEHAEENPSAKAWQQVAGMQLQEGYRLEEEGAREEAMEYFEDARISLDKAIEFEPENPDLLVGRASTLFSQQDIEEAKDDLEQALEISPNHRQGLDLYGYLLMNMGEYEEAINNWEKILEQERVSEEEQQQIEEMIQFAESMMDGDFENLDMEGVEEELEEDLVEDPEDN